MLSQNVITYRSSYFLVYGANVIITKKDGTSYRFPLTGRLEAISDRFSNVLTFTTTAGQLVRISTATGRYADISYNGSNLKEGGQIFKRSKKKGVRS